MDVRGLEKAIVEVLKNTKLLYDYIWILVEADMKLKDFRPKSLEEYDYAKRKIVYDILKNRYGDIGLILSLFDLIKDDIVLNYDKHC